MGNLSVKHMRVGQTLKGKMDHKHHDVVERALT